jgi:16S rRNA (cytosine967-C5)-methyltransferase
MADIQKNLYYDLQTEILTTLKTIFWENTYATKAIQHTLNTHQDWEDDKRAMFSETVYDIIRWWRPLWYILDTEPLPDEQYLQLLIPAYLFSKKGDLTALQKNKGLHANQLFERIQTVKNTRTLRESIPDWLDSQGQQELGSRWDTVIASLNQPAPLTIRVNTLKISLKELHSLLQKGNISNETLTCCPDALLLPEKINVFQLASFRQGFFEVQDAASQMVSRFLDPQPGMRIIDACAGEGSKTLHLACLLQNKGKIIALDTQDWRLKELKKRAAKAGVDTIETRLIDSSKVYKRLEGTADRLLLDVPCSGLGTVRRNPDIKWKLTAADLDRLRVLQQELLDRYCTLLKPQGILVYSVCSILPSEAEEHIKSFLQNHPNFQLQKEQRTWPDIDTTDGFYMARLQRTT